MILTDWQLVQLAKVHVVSLSLLVEREEVVRLIFSSAISTVYAAAAEETETKTGLGTSGSGSAVGVMGDMNSSLDCLKMWCE